MAANEDVLFEVKNGVATITFNRPNKGNAITPAMLELMAEKLKAYTTDDNVRVIVLTGKGKLFCSGMDLSAGNQSKLQKSTTAPTGFTDVCDLLMRHPKPIVTCLNGPALGGGCVFLFLGDVRIASKDAYIQFAEVKRGLIPAMISCYIIPSIGPFRASDMFLTGRKVTAQRCYEWGMLSEVADPSNLQSVTQRYVDELIGAGPEAIRLCKDLIRYVQHNTHEDNVKKAQGIFQQCIKSPEMKEGLAAMREKRKPKWAQVGAEAIPSKL